MVKTGYWLVEKVGFLAYCNVLVGWRQIDIVGVVSKLVLGASPSVVYSKIYPGTAAYLRTTGYLAPIICVTPAQNVRMKF